MALKSIGILLALCATLSIALEQESKYQPVHKHHQRPDDVNYPFRIAPDSYYNAFSEEDLQFNNPNYPYSYEQLREWGHHDSAMPYFPYSSEQSEQKAYLNSLEPHFPYNSQQSGNWEYRDPSKPYFPHYPQQYGEWEHKSFPKPQNSYNSQLGDWNYHINKLAQHNTQNSLGSGGFSNPHYSYGSQEPGQYHSLSMSLFSPNLQEQIQGPRSYRPDWYNPDFPQNTEQKKNLQEMDRRRPFFYPIYPYHPFYTHTQPTSTNDEEFETIESLKVRNNQESQEHSDLLENENQQENLGQGEHHRPHHHGSHNHHYPMNSDSSDENGNEQPFWPFHHGYPHFHPHIKEPVNLEVVEDSFVNSEEFPTSGEVQPLSVSESNEDFQGPLGIIENHVEHIKFPSTFLDMFEQLHHGHGKPHHHGSHKPNENSSEVDEEGSGDEIIPLSAEARIPLIQDDDVVEEEE